MIHLKRSFSVAALVVVSLFFSTCDRIEHRNGWYYVTDCRTMKLSDKPFMTIEDIAEVCIEKDGIGNEVIMLRLKKEGIKKMEEATDAYKGKYIAFFCNDSVITKVLVNEKISSEFLQVAVQDEEQLHYTYKTLKGNIK